LQTLGLGEAAGRGAGRNVRRRPSRRLVVSDLLADPYTSRRIERQGLLSYVTGSHAFKGGFALQQGTNSNEVKVNQDITSRCSTGSAFVTGNATPYTVLVQMNANLGLYAQDQWTIKRLTLNLGGRFDYINASVPEIHLPAVRFVGHAIYAEVRRRAELEGLLTRLGVAMTCLATARRPSR